MNKYEPEMEKDDTAGKTNEETKTLPHLPLPSLASSADCLTRWFTPFLTNEQRAKSRTALNAFIEPQGLGSQLHARLQSMADMDDDNHWLNDYWTSRFLAKRSSTAINDNFFCLFRHGEADRIKRTAALIAAALNYKLVLDQGHTPIATKRHTILCEKQLKNLFSTTRIPGEQTDSLRGASPIKGMDANSSMPRHIVVFCRSNIYLLELISRDGHPHSLKDIEKGLEVIVDSSLDEQSSGRSIGHLTTLPRTDWARTRKSLIQGSQNNAFNLELIETALFSIQLEECKPDDNLAACQQLLSGDSGNRWFDKSLQFIIFNDGFAGLNIEHSGLDRATIVDFLDYILGIDPQSIDQYSGASDQGTPLSKNLTFDLTPAFQKKIMRAARSYKKRQQEIASKILQFTEFDIKLLAQNGISPDAFAQCALQLTHWRLFGRPAAVGQNITMRHFAFGRVQSLWVLTSELIDFVNTMLNTGADSRDKYQALKKAALQHEVRIKECRKGDVAEQHMAELLNIYNRHPEDFQADFLTRMTSGGLSQLEINDALALFESTGWTCMHNKAFNTSFLASPTVLYQGFKPVDPGNIAISCVIHNGDLNIFACACKAQEERLVEILGNWQQVLVELQSLLRHNGNLPNIESDLDD
ncbi:MAG: choline/carnitine O-acyltransferase [bacterium]|nr:choline/carnitine O-acyltransferase [bacterium]